MTRLKLKPEVTGGAEIISRNGVQGVIIFDQLEGHTRVRVGHKSSVGKTKDSRCSNE